MSRREDDETRCFYRFANEAGISGTAEGGKKLAHSTT